ncbi:CAP-associated domain-containing protein [Paenibacillus sp. LHD-38]|uniref:CAP-associated domain-containing protein n=1 Tax=Paenibacillus sp. LHD-38 TaxID=3072143 RepID=UPI00280D5001|nr:CAP-associated domain-containing protein [Paenibacillus sp. LHD-38]MDQ8733383.1 CAP-associated domain-containing protein [Paenibacillus sp. LHD-38]
MHQLNKSVSAIKKGGITAVLLLLAFSAPTRTFGEATAFKDTNGHWAGSYISWAVDQKLALGYGDGSFKPNNLINEAEFLAMLLRTYNLAVESPSTGSVWSKPYYDYANNHGWPLSPSPQNKELRRGEAALLLASAANGKAFTEQSAIQWLLDEKISNGRTSATVTGFSPDGKLTRAEALTFFYNLKQHSKTLSDAKIIKTNHSLGGISLNETLEKLQNTLGKPSRIDPSEYGFSWHVYRSSYSHYMMFGVQNSRVVALFSNAGDDWVSPSGVKIGQTIESAKKLVKNAVSPEHKDDYYAYTIGGEQITLFYDSQDANKIAGIMRMNQSVSKPVKSAYASKLESAFEQQLFDLANAERAIRGIPLLQWDKLAAASAHSHSSDMNNRDFFDHTNPDGSSPFDRMKAKGVIYHSAAENIAAGYSNSIFAHYGWLNSKSGHRETMLDSKLKRLGTGISVGGSYQTYYTQNFYTP